MEGHEKHETGKRPSKECERGAEYGIAQCIRRTRVNGTERTKRGANMTTLRAHGVGRKVRRTFVTHSVCSVLSGDISLSFL